MSQPVVDSADFLAALAEEVHDARQTGLSGVATVYEAIAAALTRYADGFNGGRPIPVDVVRAVTLGVTIYAGKFVARDVEDRVDTLIGLYLTMNIGRIV